MRIALESRFLRDAFLRRLSNAEDLDPARATPSSYAPARDANWPAPFKDDNQIEHRSVWATGFDNTGSTDSDGNAKAIKRQTGGVLLGGDTLLSDMFRIGLGGGYSRTSFDVSDLASKGESDNFHLGFYGGVRLSGVGLKLGAAYSWHDMTVARTAAFPGFSEMLTGKVSDATAQAFGDLSYRYSGGPRQSNPSTRWPMSMSTANPSSRQAAQPPCSRRRGTRLSPTTSLGCALPTRSI